MTTILSGEKEETMKWEKYRNPYPAVSCFTNHAIIELEIKLRAKKVIHLPPKKHP